MGPPRGGGFAITGLRHRRVPQTTLPSQRRLRPIPMHRKLNGCGMGAEFLEGLRGFWGMRAPKPGKGT
jgi:hypothetical protein